MTTIPAGHSGNDSAHFVTEAETKQKSRRGKIGAAVLALSVMLMAAPFGFAQGAPKITGVDPGSGKVNDSVTVSGANLAKDSVTAVFLSDEKTDYKAVIVSQAADKIVMKVPQVKPGSYNVSIQVGTGILIEPIRFAVQE